MNSSRKPVLMYRFFVFIHIRYICSSNDTDLAIDNAWKLDSSIQTEDEKMKFLAPYEFPNW